MTIQIRLTPAAARQAAEHAPAILGQAYGELDRRTWDEPTNFFFHVFAGPGGDYLMRPAGEDSIAVDVCLWEETEGKDGAPVMIPRLTGSLDE